MTNRVEFLDGLRGWACVVVIIAHSSETPRPVLTDKILSFLADGSFSVLVFFTISGFALSCVKPESVLKAVLARVPRLFLPTLCILQLGWLLDDRKPVNFVFYPFLLLTQWFFLSEKPAPFLPHDALHSFWLASRFGQTWTMQPEIHGSFFVFFWKLVHHKLRCPWAVLAAITLVLVVTDYFIVFFVIGFVLEHFWVSVNNEVLGLPVLFVSLALHYPPLYVAPGAVVLVTQMFAVLRIGTLFFAIKHSALLRRGLECRFSKFIGVTSFGAYLFHKLIIWMLYDYAYPHPTQDFLAATWVRYMHTAIVLVTSFGCSAMFTPIERRINAKVKDCVAWMMDTAPKPPQEVVEMIA